MIAKEYPDGTSESWTYIGNQPNPHTHTDQSGHVTTDTYDSRGNLLEEVDPLGRTTIYTYGAEPGADDVDQPGDGGAGLGGDDVSYDAHQNLLETTYPDGTTTQSAYNSAGQLISDTDQLGRTTTYTYDGFGGC